jgi:4-alpha-glucanotransferase
VTEPAAWGIDPGADPATARALLDAMGATDDGPPDPPPMRFVRPGEEVALDAPGDVVLEDGTELAGVRSLPPDLPLGYHQLRRRDAVPELVVVTPGRCHLPAGLRAWGWAVQLAATRSRDSWGIGDLVDLRRLGAWAAGRGAGFVALSPLHAPAPATPQQPSPYYASSRRFRNPLHLRVEEVDGAREAGPAVDGAAAAGRALLADRRIDRDAVWASKREALEACFGVAGGDPAFARWQRAAGPAVEDWARWCALAERHGGDWRGWPVTLRHPRDGAVADATGAAPERVAFFAWLQWQLGRQVAAVPLPVVHDLAVGFDPGGFDSWAWQDLLALDARIGAPPDEFNRAGQDWGLPPFVPWRLRQVSYAPFVETLRSVLQGAGGLRVDHVMGLFRLFWVPPEAGPADGAYVRYPAGDLLDILALESARAGAVVIGEDLGTVEAGVRDELASRDVLSMRLLWFEDDPPAAWPERSLALVTTHDLPTVVGVWTGSDVDDQRTAGVPVAEEGATALRQRLSARTGLPDDAPVADVVVGAHRALAAAPSALVAATLEDALRVGERPNMPGTTDSWPNWSLALPVPVEEVETDPGVAAVADALAEGRGPVP